MSEQTRSSFQNNFFLIKTRPAVQFCLNIQLEMESLVLLIVVRELNNTFWILTQS